MVMLFRHFFAFPPASDMSSVRRLFTAASSQPAASGLGRVTAVAQHHGGSSKKAKSTDKENRKRITSRWHLNNRSAVPGGKGRCPFNKRSRSYRGDGPAPPRRRRDFWGWTFLRVWAVPSHPWKQRDRAVASILYNTNLMLSRTTVWFGIQISPVKAWRSHGKHDSRLDTPSSRFGQREPLLT